jgi:hypothetical protein
LEYLMYKKGIRMLKKPNTTINGKDFLNIKKNNFKLKLSINSFTLSLC